MTVPPHERRTKKRFMAAFLPLLTAVGLCGFQFGDRNGLNSMPFAQVRPLASDLAKAQKLASEGNIEILAGQTLQGKEVSLRGELTDANCFLGYHTHAYDHAFCAKLCVAAGSPLVFIPDQGSQIYIVLTQQNAVEVPTAALDQIGVPGILVKGRLLNANGLPALALEDLAK